MKHRILSFALLSIAIAPTSAAARGVDDLAWLAGSWAGDSAGTRIEEHWMAPLGGQMVGMHRDVVGGRAVSFEFFRIASDSAGVAYLSSPRGRPATRFGLAESGPRRVVFENPAHDFPQRILYWLDPRGRLHARIEGTMHGRAESEEWTWKKSRLVP
jgi:hypothetical protein